MSESKRKYRVRCWQCGGEGVSGHECGEDTCVCLYPVDNEECDICDGKGYWDVDEMPSDPDLEFWSLEEE
jgi:hypothetical protein